MKKLCLFITVAIGSLVYVQPAQSLDLKALQEELHRRGDPWIAGTTSVSELSIEEKRKLVISNPIFFNEASVRKERFALSRKTKGEKPPASLDWRNKDGHNWMTPVKDQHSPQNCGSCWAFGWVAAMEGRINILNNTPETNTDLSEQFVVSCNPYGWGCVQGGWVGDWVKTDGIPDEACYPYVALDATSGAPCNNRCTDWESRGTRITDWAQEDAASVDRKKEMLMDGPIAVVLDMKEDFFYYKGGVYEPIMGEKYLHATCCAGWTSSGNWIIKQAWGPGWGDGGYANYPDILYPAWMTIEASNIPNIALDNSNFYEPNNNIWDPGETVDITVTLKNNGIDATNVLGTLSTTDSYITNIVNGTFSFGNILNGGSSNNSASPFIVTASSSTPEPHTVPFTLQVTADGGYSKLLNFTGAVGWKSEFESPGTVTYGLAFDGTYLWATDFWATTIKKLNAAMGTVIGEIPTPNNDSMNTGIAWDGTNLWVHSNKNKKIYKVNPSNGNVLTSFDSPATQYPTGLAFDGTHLWAVDLTAYKIYKITTAGATVSSFDIPISPAPYMGPRGLAFEPKGPNGGSLLLLMSHLRQGKPVYYDSTVVWEISRTGSLIQHKATPDTNGRAIEVHPYAGKYWVNTLVPAKIYRIDGLYEAGIEELLPEKRVLSLTVSPNPSRDQIQVSFCVPNNGKTTLNIYDIAGKLVYRLVDREFKAGTHQVIWNGKDQAGKEIPYGIYFLRLKLDKSISTKKIILLK